MENRDKPSEAMAEKASATHLGASKEILWRRDWEESVPTLQKFGAELSRQPRKNIEIARVSQLDAKVLDSEISDLLLDQVRRAFTYLQPGLAEKLRPEIEALIQLCIFRFSIWENKPTPGQKIQNLIYRNERVFSRPELREVLRIPGDSLSWVQKSLYGLLTILVAWTWKRVRRYASLQNWSGLEEGDYRKKLWRAMERLDTVFRVISTANFLLFLHSGVYPSLVERILAMRMVYPSLTPLDRGITFEYLNREILMGSLKNFLETVIPLANWSAIAQRMRRWFWKSSPQQRATGPLSLACVICQQERALTPYILDCGDICCYFCLKSACAMDTKYSCPSCGQDVIVADRLEASDIKKYAPNK